VNINTGATLTGGATTVLSPAGITPGRSVFVGPNHSRLTPETVTFTASTTLPSKANAIGSGRTGLRIVVADQSTEEGCCTTVRDEVTVDMIIKSTLASGSAALIDRALALLRALAYSSALETAVENEVLPQS